MEENLIYPLSESLEIGAESTTIRMTANGKDDLVNITLRPLDNSHFTITMSVHTKDIDALELIYKMIDDPYHDYRESVHIVSDTNIGESISICAGIPRDIYIHLLMYGNLRASVRFNPISDTQRLALSHLFKKIANYLKQYL